MKKKKQRALIAVVSTCLAVSMMPTQVFALETPGVMGSVETSAEKTKSERTTYRLTDGFRIMGEDDSKWRANSKNSVAIEVQHGDLYYENGAVRNTAKNVFLHITLYARCKWKKFSGKPYSRSFTGTGANLFTD